MTTIRHLLFIVILVLGSTGIGCAQQTEAYQIVVSPESVELQVDESIQLSGTVQDANGTVVQDSVLFYSRDRNSVSVTSSGKAKALKAGTFELMAYTMSPDSNRLNKSIPVVVSYPPVTNLSFINMPETIYTDTETPIHLSATDANGKERKSAEISLSSSDPSVASINSFSRIDAHQSGTVTITAQSEGVTARRQIQVMPNPVTDLQLTNDAQNVRTGDVVHFDARTLNASGEAINDVPVEYSFSAQPDDNLGEGTSGQIQGNGRFVANKAGLYTIVARAGSASAENTIRVEARDIQKDLEVVGHGLVSDVHTSDLWVWEGVDGGDYAITGTWGGNGEAYFWDVTDPANMTIIDTVTVDARTVNDVKISEDGRIGVISREGASDRKNGIVILDVNDPHNVSIISEYTQGLTGGVHNTFIYQDHVFAVNNGRRYDIIDISDPENPETVSRFELDTPGHAIHDVWVENGIAYSSNWSDGIVAVDVGSTPGAQSPEQHDTGVGSFKNPVKLGSYTYPSGWNHAAFPFKSKSTDNFYVVAGDEAFPNGLFIHDKPTVPAGWIHFIKFEEGWDNPKEVARYEVPEAGTHNFWIKDDTLYVAYYNAGLRVVDISGELMGNLYEQGREIAKYVPVHHEGFIPNAAMTWGPQPYKGHIFISDWNSGIWALKLEE